MNPYGDTNLNPGIDTPPPYSSSNPYEDSDNSSVFTVPSSQVSCTDHSSVTVLSYNSTFVASSDQNGVQNAFTSTNMDPSSSTLPPLDQNFNHGSSIATISQTVSNPSQNPYPATATPTYPNQVTINIPSPAIRPSPLQSQCSEESCPELECAICFSQFNNVFRCPKMLQCKHTFCLECLARMNVKSVQPNAIQCPLCRGLTPLPTLGLPRLTTDTDVLSYLPAAMQRVYSIKFLRNKGKLQVKRSAEGRHRSLPSLRSDNRTLNVGLPSPPSRGEEGGMAGALFRLTGRPVCRAFLLMSVVMMMVLLTCIIIFLLTFKSNKDSE